MNELSVYLHPITNTIPLKPITINDVCKIIRSEKYKAITEKIRSYTTKEERDSCKKYNFDYVTFSGTFTNRSDSALIKHSGYFCIDIDHVGNESEIQSLSERIIKFKPSLVFKSPSGDGLKIVFKINIEQATHKDYYYAFETFFRSEFGLQIDEACKDVSRACFLCHDSNCYFNENSTVFDIEFINKHKKEIPIIKSEYEQGDRVGDLYNQSIDSIQNTVSLLTNAGWKKMGNTTWCRPEKDNGVSATFGYIAPNIFFPFSSNSQPFEANKAYTPFQVLAILKFNGDFKEAAKSLVPQYGNKDVPMKVLNGHAKLDPTEIEKLLERSKIDTKRDVKRPPIILSIKEQSGTQFIYKRLFTLGNFSCIIGKAKSRKTYLLSLLTASIINPNANAKFKSELPNNKRGVLYFDTEQGEYDCYNVIKRIETLAQVGTMRSFSLREFSPLERCAIIEHAFTLWGEETGYCVIDGIADLVNAINDEIEATRVVSILLRLTKQYNCHISTVLHQNKGDGFATGHIGSAIMKKAEILITVAKANGNPQLSDVSCDLNRGIDFDPFCIAIDDNAMPYITGSTKKDKTNGSPFMPQPMSVIGMIPISELHETPENNDCPF